MRKSKDLDAVAVVRRIRDRLARKLAGLSDAEIIAYYREHGRFEVIQEDADRSKAPNKRLQPASARPKRAGGQHARRSKATSTGKASRGGARR